MSFRIIYVQIYNIIYNIYNSVTIHTRNIQSLATELFKVVTGKSPEIMKEVFPLKESLPYCTKFPFETKMLGPLLTVKTHYPFLDQKFGQLYQ